MGLYNRADCEGRKCWAWELSKVLRNISSEYHPHGRQAFVDEHATLSSLCKAYDGIWNGFCMHLRQAMDCTKMACHVCATYFAWFDSGLMLHVQLPHTPGQLLGHCCS